MATTSPSPSVSENRPGALRDAQAFDRQNSLGRIPGDNPVEMDLAAEHGVDRALIVERLLVEDAGDDAVAHRDDAVGKPPDVRHAVRDIEDRHALLAQPVEQREQPIGLGARQRGGRLVEDQHFRLVRHGASNRHHLAVGQRKIADAGLEVDGQSHAVGDGLCLAAHAARIEQGRRAAAAQPVQRQIGGDIEIGDDAVIDVLMNGDDTGTDRLRRRASARSPGQQEPSCRRRAHRRR